MKKLFGLMTAFAVSFSAVTVFANGGASAAGGQDMLVTFVPFIVLIVGMYFILIRPQKKKEKETREMLNSLVVGDEIVTIGGIVGKVVKVKENKVTIETGSDRVKLEFERGAVGRVTKKNEKAVKTEESEANKALEQEKAEMEQDKE